jgi:hypothetical protein
VCDYHERTSVHLDFDLVDNWLSIGRNTFVINLTSNQCVYCQEPAKPDSFESVHGSISGQKTVQVHLYLPLCENHSPKKDPKGRKKKSEVGLYIGAVLFMVALTLVTYLLHGVPFFSAHTLFWSYAAAFMIMLIVGIVIMFVLDRIKKALKIGAPALSPAVVMDGNLDFHFLRAESARQLQHQLDDSRTALEHWRNRTIEEQMDDGSGFVRSGV